MAATSAGVRECPECGAEPQRMTTETVCPACGLVLEDAPIDHGPDWGIADGEENPERAKPGNRDLPDRGLGSEVGFAGERSSKEHRLERWHRQARASTADQGRGYATTEIQRIGSALELGDGLIKQAKHLFRQLQDAGEVQGRDMDTIAATCVYTVSRVHQRGLTPGEVADVARTNARLIGRRHTWACRTLGVEVPPPDPTQRIRVVGAALDVGEATVARAIWLCERMDDAARSNGSPSTLAAACLYRASERTQRECASAADVTDAALRSRLSDVPTMEAL